MVLKIVQPVVVQPVVVQPLAVYPVAVLPVVVQRSQIKSIVVPVVVDKQ